MTRIIVVLISVAILFLLGCGDVNSGTGSSEPLAWSDDYLREYVARHPDCRVMDLSLSNITDAGLGPLRQLKWLEHLDIGANPQHTDDCLQTILRLKKLKHLGIADTRISEGGILSLAMLTELTELSLTNTVITDEGLSKLCDNMSSLRALNLSSTRITDEGLIHLGKLSNLEVLGMSRTAITDDGMATICTFSNLKKLVLNSTKITDFGLEHAAKMTSLVELDVSYMPQVTTNGVAALKTRLPNLKIIRF